MILFIKQIFATNIYQPFKLYLSIVQIIFINRLNYIYQPFKLMILHLESINVHTYRYMYMNRYIINLLI